MERRREREREQLGRLRNKKPVLVLVEVVRTD